MVFGNTPGFRVKCVQFDAPRIVNVEAMPLMPAIFAYPKGNAVINLANFDSADVG